MLFKSFKITFIPVLVLLGFSPNLLAQSQKTGDQKPPVPKVGIFDSGRGGFSVLKEITRQMPYVEAYYIADQAYFPYGDLESWQIKERCLALTQELIKEDVDLVVIACNTATITALPFLEQRFAIPFIGVEPLANYEPSDQKGKSILVLTTPVTGNSQRFRELKRRLEPENQITQFSCPNMARIVESFIDNPSLPRLISAVKEELAALKGQKFDEVVLGCTHYAHIASVISLVVQAKHVTANSYIACLVKNALSEIF
ncbi:MAG: glutamate racemase, partial [Halobacteriovoraceae bacterium]|nr:glutamate racemase [Halobacteriovoraceae bacterium]